MKLRVEMGGGECRGIPSILRRLKQYSPPHLHHAGIAQPADRSYARSGSPPEIGRISNGTNGSIKDSLANGDISAQGNLMATAMLIVGAVAGLCVAGYASAETPKSALLTGQMINEAALSDIPVEPVPVPNDTAGSKTAGDSATAAEALGKRSPAIIRLQVLLDRAGASPGVIDGYDGENVRNAVGAFEEMKGLPVDGKIGPEVISAIDSPDQAVGTYKIGDDDISTVVQSLPKDYAKLAELNYLGYTSIAEGIAERFHMDTDLLKALNEGVDFRVGKTIVVTAVGDNKDGQAVKVEVDKKVGQVRAYDAKGSLLAAYPATIGSDANPSPSGTHVVKAVVENPTYTYNPKLNFKQGNNDKILTLPPGPNGPVGVVWIDLSEPTYGIHGTPEPARIDKTGSHGCVRLTNWDAQELGKMLAKGVPVTFLP